MSEVEVIQNPVPTETVNLRSHHSWARFESRRGGRGHLEPKGSVFIVVKKNGFLVLQMHLWCIILLAYAVSYFYWALSVLLKKW